MQTEKAALALLMAIASASGVSASEAAACMPANFRMAIDVGHTRQRYGALSVHGKPEFEFNRNLAEELLAKLREKGFTGTEAVIQSDSDLERRARDLSSRRPDLMLSLHHDSVEDKYLKTGLLDGQMRTYTEGFHGYSIFVSRDNAYLEDSETFASLLGSELRAQGLTPTYHHEVQEHRQVFDRPAGVFFYDALVVLHWTRAPAVLLESAVITDREDEQQAESPAYRGYITDAIIAAVLRFCDGLAARAATRTASPPVASKKQDLRK